MPLKAPAFGSTGTGGPPVILSRAEQLAQYFVSNLDQIDGKSVASVASRVGQSEGLVRQALQAARVLLLPQKKTICELERGYGWLIRVSTDPVMVGKAALRWLRYLRTRSMNLSYGLEAVGYDVSTLRQFAADVETMVDDIVALTP